MSTARHRMAPQFGVRAIAEAAGLDGHEAMALARSGHGGRLAAMAVTRHFARPRLARDDREAFIRSTEEITFADDWEAFIRSAEEIN